MPSLQHQNLRFHLYIHFIHSPPTNTISFSFPLPHVARKHGMRTETRIAFGRDRFYPTCEGGIFLPFTTLYPTRSTGRDGHTEGSVHFRSDETHDWNWEIYQNERGEGFPFLAMMTFVCPLQRTHTLHTALFLFDVKLLVMGMSDMVRSASRVMVSRRQRGRGGFVCWFLYLSCANSWGQGHCINPHSSPPWAAAISACVVVACRG